MRFGLLLQKAEKRGCGNFTYWAAVSQGIKLALNFISVILKETRQNEGRKTNTRCCIKGRMLQCWQNSRPNPRYRLLTTKFIWMYMHLYISERLLYVLVCFVPTLSAVISSSASAVVSSSSVFACCSWLSSARRAACRLLIWDSRSCRERVNSDTCRLISSFSSSCSRPICRETRPRWMLSVITPETDYTCI